MTMTLLYQSLINCTITPETMLLLSSDFQTQQ